MTRIILRNICCNWVGFAVGAATLFFLTPFVLRHLGDARYGIWVLALSVTGSYGILAFGLQAASTQYLTRHLASNDYARMNKSFSTGFTILTRVAAVLVVVSFVLAWLGPNVFNVSPDLKAEFSWCIIIIGCNAACQMAMFPFSAVLVATQRFDLKNLIAITLHILYAVLAWFVLSLGYGLIAICLVGTVSQTIGHIARWRVAYCVLPQLNVPRRSIDSERLRELRSFGVWAFLLSIAQSVFVQVDALIIGMFLPIAALAPYALAIGLSRQIEGLLTPVARVFSPLATNLHARSSEQELRTMYLAGSRSFLVLTTVVCVVAAVWAEDFFRLWVGQEYLTGKDYPSVALLFHLLLIALVARLVPGLGVQTLLGSLRVRSVAIASITEAVSNLILNVILVQYWGLLGIAYGTILSAVIFRAFVIPCLVAKYLHITVSAYLLQACLRPVILGVTFGLVAMQLHDIWRPSNFPEFFCLLALTGLCAGPFVLIVGMTSRDRNRLLYSPILKRAYKPKSIQ